MPFFFCKFFKPEGRGLCVLVELQDDVQKRAVSMLCVYSFCFELTMPQLVTAIKDALQSPDVHVPCIQMLAWQME